MRHHRISRRDLQVAWAVVWVGGAVFDALPQNGNALLVITEYLIGVGALSPRTWVPIAALGLLLSLGFWAFSQDLGSLTSGQATDPNTGPVLALMAIVLLAELAAWDVLTGGRQFRPMRSRTPSQPATPQAAHG